MFKTELRIAISGGRHIAVTAVLPDPRRFGGAVIFASPGGGYSRRYWDLQLAGHQKYSEAEHHAAEGRVFIAYDHLGVGESSHDDLDSVSIEDIARANHEAVAQVEARLRKGTLHEAFPAVPRAAMIGIGQSMGGGVSIIMQARHRSFAAVAVLGYSAIHTVLPQREPEHVERGKAAYGFGRSAPADMLSVAEASAQVIDFVYPFHWEDVPRDLLEADMAGGYPVRTTAPDFGSLTIPPCVVAMMSPGYVKDEAALIDVPLFLGFGERDTSPDPRAEPSAFPACDDITVAVIPRMAHMHNFAGTRALLWERLGQWADGVARRSWTRERE
jgi:pimeloyl-ACP methyl ester carboxylesterase